MGTLFAGVFQIKKECRVCGLSYFREPGYYIGAMILNYGVTTALLLALYLVSLASPLAMPWGATTRLLFWMCMGVLLSLAMMRHAYSLWLSLDYWFEPWPDREEQG